MGARGPAPKPIEQRRLIGNPSRRPIPPPGELLPLPGVRGIPDPHRPVGAVGRALWEQIWRCGAVWIARDVDVEMVLMVCELADERQALRVRVLSDNDPKERRGLRDLDRLLMSSLGVLGFNPTDRIRLGVAEVKRMSVIEELQARAASR